MRGCRHANITSWQTKPNSITSITYQQFFYVNLCCDKFSMSKTKLESTALQLIVPRLRQLPPRDEPITPNLS